MKQTDYPEWETQSRSLTKDEVNDPKIVFEEIFDFAHLPEWRNLLWEWLKITVSGSYNTASAESERGNILFVYEKLQKLIEVSHLIHLQQQQFKQADKEKERHIF